MTAAMEDYIGLCNETGKRVVMLVGDNCPHCESVKPMMMTLTAEHGLDVTFFNIKGFESGELTQLGIRGIPAVLSVGDGAHKVLTLGGVSKMQLKDALTRSGVIKQPLNDLSSLL